MQRPPPSNTAPAKSVRRPPSGGCALRQRGDAAANSEKPPVQAMSGCTIVSTATAGDQLAKNP